MIDEFITQLNKQPLDELVSPQSDLYEDLKELVSIRHWDQRQELFETRNNTAYVVPDLSGNFIRTGRINLNGLPLKDSKDIVELTKILGNKKFETSRVLYLKDGKIVGQDAITIDMPSRSPSHGYIGKKYNGSFDFIRKKMERLHADSYCMLHNHPTGDSNTNSYDMRSWKDYSEHVPGFKYGIVVGKNNYTVYTISEDGSEDVEFQGTLDPPDNSVKWADLPNYIHRLDRIYREGSSFLIYADARFNLISIQRIGDIEFKDKNIWNYIKNEKHQNGATFCYLCTYDEDIYYDACKLCGDPPCLFIDVIYSTLNTYKDAREDYDHWGQIVGDKKPKAKLL